MDARSATSGAPYTQTAPLAACLQVLTTSDDLKTSACCTAGAPPPLVREALRKVRLGAALRSREVGARGPSDMGLSPPHQKARSSKLRCCPCLAALTHQPRHTNTHTHTSPRAFPPPTPPHPTHPATWRQVPDEVKAKYYGCGSPFPMGIEGLRVLDLGSGSGRDCYVCADLVGERGSVTGVDMTPAQLAVARKYADEYCTQVGPGPPRSLPSRSPPLPRFRANWGATYWLSLTCWA